MNNINYVHLHVHNEYSILDGLGSADAYAKKAAELGFEYLALTNHGNIDGLIKFQKACQKYDIKPVLGCEAYIVPQLSDKLKGEKRGHITLLIKNQKGFENLCIMLSKANLEGFYRRPRIDYDLLYDYCKGLVIMTGCSSSFLNLNGGEDLFYDLSDKIKDDLYLEVMPHKFKEQNDLNKRLVKLASKNHKLVATNDCHYINKENYKTQEVLLAIQSKAKWSDPNRWRFNIQGLHLRTADEMFEAFIEQNILSDKQIKESLFNTIEVAEKCTDFKIEKQKIYLPKVPGYEYVENESDFLYELCINKFKSVKKYAPVEAYYNRLDLEFDLIEKKGFVPYFMVVYDLVKWCKEKGIMIGPGRGCFSGDTKVSLLDGTERTFKELTNSFKDREFWVYSCNKNGKIVPGKAKNPRITKIVNKVCKITLDNNEIIISTLDHKFLMRNNIYKEARELKSGDSLMPLYRVYTPKGYEKYYDIKTDKWLFTHYMKFKQKQGHVVHHKNFDKNDNRPDNCEQLTCKEHGDLHATTNSERWNDKKWRKKAIKRYWEVLGSPKNRKATSERNKTEEHRKKVSEGQKRKWSDTEYKNWMLNKLNTKEILEKKSKEAKETYNQKLGSPKNRKATSERNKTEEHRKKVSEGRKKYFQTEKGLKEKEKIKKRMSGRILSKETKQKISNSKKGTILTEDQKNKISAALKGRIITENHRNKISAALKGKTKSKETKKKMSKARYKYLSKIKNHKVLKIEFIEEKREMYDIEVEQYHNFALSSGVFVHNSVGGSLVAYLLGITLVDPIRYDLLFSRFISEERADYPDIDLDFEDSKRDLVRAYLEELYGKNNIASISTFLTMKGRAAIRDVSRVFDIPLKEVNEFSKSIAYDEDDEVIERACIETPEGKAFDKKYPEICDHAIILEGTIRSYGKHAAAVIISADDLRKGTKGNLCSRNNVIVSNWDMEDSEYMGLMKLDVLGLNTLSILNEAKKLIKENHDIDIEYEKLPLNDKQVYKEISDGYNVGVFQINTWATTRLAKELRPDSIELLSDLIALVRPGAMDSGMTDEYILRRNGKHWEKKHPIYEKIVENTYGVLVYQEQVMDVVHKVAGLPYSTADKIRKIIAKKHDTKLFAPFKKEFIKGCTDQKTLSKEEAKEFWETLQAHGRYSFNKAHSTAYAIIGYWCVDGRTLLYDWDKKEYVSIAKAFREGISKIACYDEKRKKTIAGKVKKIIRTTGRYHINLKMGYIVKTKSGKRLCCSQEHKFLTPNGYIPLMELKEGDLVAVEKRISPTSSIEVAKKISLKIKEQWKDRESITTKKRLAGCSKGGKTVAPIVKKRWKTMGEEERKRRLLPWIEAAAKSKNGYCSRYVGPAKDGHFVFSWNEYCLDNWLFENGIEHQTQVFINGRPADFFCKGIYIEFDGMNRPESYFIEKFKDEPFIVISNINQIEEKLHFLLEEENLRKGNEIIFEPIKKISKWKNRVMYDVVMESEPHNFLANGIVVHNCAYTKYHWPAEFICANLIHGADSKKEELIEEAKELGLKLMLPKVGISDALKWVVQNDKLYVPFIEIKGIGEKSALQCIKLKTKKQKKKGFFEINDIAQENKTKIEKILEAIGAYNNRPADNISDYFTFNID